MNEIARIIQAHGKSFLVELPAGRRYKATTRSKKTDFAVGDQVEVGLLNEEQAVIERALPRTSLLYRSDEWREKLIAANVTQIVVVLAAVPSFYEELLNRCLVAAEDDDIRVLILLNKADLPETANARKALEPYRQLGYPMLELSATENVEALWPYLENHLSVFVGQSGMGKSTLVNGLLPEARVRTREISEALDSGKHTTTHATLYRLPNGGELIDSPGLQEFGLRHLREDRLISLFPELRGYAGKCRFQDCKHQREPDCALIAAEARGDILPQRLQLLRKLQSECKKPTH
ncbi:ribosome small subunit-dependent GTPase A [Chitinimonas arctica]|uniref:Small ribosomal subunit biogenesis GTPase RsgA n=1 Tax=Chitinimonas arctica TaxID=2594795 RepID=A0A516SJL3_9NEIS|nr:ribosome small subunit-dependent GTPase A [Chitinimonas arctica]QDQ28349.1 ribosome small subunit-dependent GTPase A [Chitinimonas arctica]